MTLGGVPVAGSAGGCAMFRTQVLVVACTLSPMASWPVGAVTVIAAVPLCPSLVAVIVADATGTFDTVTNAVPLCPSLVAVIVAVPVATPLTSPLPFTLATAPLLDCQVMTRPVNGFPLASCGVAVSCAV